MIQNPQKPVFILQLYEMKTWRLKSIAKSYDQAKLEHFVKDQLVQVKDQVYFNPEGPLANYVPPVQTMGQVGVINLGSYQQFFERQKSEWEQFMNSAEDIDVIISKGKTGPQNNLRSIKPDQIDGGKP